MDATDLKRAFARRLHEVCDDMKLPSYGRLRAMGKQFGVSPQAAKKWLDGEGFPNTDTLLEIANWANVNVNWLLQGTGTKHKEPDEAAITVAEGIESLPEDDKLQVIHYMRYTFQKPTGWFAEERKARYMHALDDLEKKQH